MHLVCLSVWLAGGDSSNAPTPRARAGKSVICGRLGGWRCNLNEWLDGRPPAAGTIPVVVGGGGASMARQTGRRARHSSEHARRNASQRCRVVHGDTAAPRRRRSMWAAHHLASTNRPRSAVPVPPSRVPSYPYRHRTRWPSVRPLVFQAFLSPAQHHPSDMGSSSCPRPMGTV